eukprot:TRINITY_DN24994_c0_g1_i2.p1 TRINITY_DN24994_c0_g1~~TRINITY_DN24994_c0_g1_i2.p1  ORF type:complete len:464 (-),score=76.06 TRINITY_DN24994_c0_g1_i2:114-1505(-)
MAAAAASVVVQKKKKDHHDAQNGRRASSIERLEAQARRCPKLPYQSQMHHAYNHPRAQYFVAFLIVANFFTTIAEKEIDPPFGERHRRIWQALEDFFNVIFLLELLCNYWGTFPLDFWRSPWNIFDFVVVCVGTLSLARVELPGEMSLLRTLRAFRVFRLFKRVKSLNKIINSIFNAVPGVANAFLIMIILMCIYAIIAVEWFSEFGARGTYSTYTLYDDTRNEIDSGTARGLIYGEEYYGTFSRALYTLWQVLTGESWSEAIARPLMFGYETPARLSGLKVGVFFTSFLVITQIVMVNVVVAVLLEKMVSDDEPDDEGEVEDEGTESSAANFRDLMVELQRCHQRELVAAEDLGQARGVEASYVSEADGTEASHGEHSDRYATNGNEPLESSKTLNGKNHRLDKADAGQLELNTRLDAVSKEVTLLNGNVSSLQTRMDEMQETLQKVLSFCEKAADRRRVVL